MLSQVPVSGSWVASGTSSMTATGARCCSVAGSIAMCSLCVAERLLSLLYRLVLLEELGAHLSDDQSLFP
ncbi:hypothetical protein H634G_11553 [Metarhizium anisopliae BRIP 53293]|uniref:Uncharacterized protein n=1 Tax=Metarhizium anisopliae BRIP 53293 TaxID=1291518 RepID=A0A0D9NH60_METAN|nr:hypothetical protein H634G_11553 [Metarhizium anisopliae BRIP 53293]